MIFGTWLGNKIIKWFTFFYSYFEIIPGGWGTYSNKLEHDFFFPAKSLPLSNFYADQLYHLFAQCNNLDYDHSGIRVKSKHGTGGPIDDWELCMRIMIDKGQTGVIEAFYWDRRGLQVAVLWDPWEEKDFPYESHTEFSDLNLVYNCD